LQAARPSSTQSGSGTFRALAKHPNFRLYWFGALFSNVGTWIQMTAQGWLVYSLTNSELYLGIVGFASAVPSLLLSLIGGVLADRVERRRLMIATQSGAMALAFLLSYLALSGQITVTHIIAVSFLSGVVNALNTPVRMGIVSDLVSRENLMNAVALNSAQFQASRMVGPAIAGALIAVVGPGWCFFANGLSFLAVIGALAAMKVPPLAQSAGRGSVWANLKEGVIYVRSSPTIAALISLAVIPSLFAMPYQSQMPAFAESVLGVGAHGLGLLMSAAGLGALVGALGVATFLRGSPPGKVLMGAAALFGIGLVTFSVSRSFELSLALLICVGLTTMVYNSLMQTSLQMLSEDRMRGRVLSLLSISTFGVMPLGQLLIGSVAELTNAPIAVGIGGALCALFALWMFVRNRAIRGLGETASAGDQLAPAIPTPQPDVGHPAGQSRSARG
jgi:MFS family permease